MSLKGMGASLVVEGSTNREVFEAYVERILSPKLRPGQVVVMDNLTPHKGERVRELIEEQGCELLYLPPYSPDFNPIEEKPSPKSRECCARPRLTPARRS
jgi:transposase